MSHSDYCQAKLEDCIIYFELSPAQLYGMESDSIHGGQDESSMIPIHWEVDCQVFVAELSLGDILSLDIEDEKPLVYPPKRKPAKPYSWE